MIIFKVRLTTRCVEESRLWRRGRGQWLLWKVGVLTEGPTRAAKD